MYGANKVAPQRWYISLVEQGKDNDKKGYRSCYEALPAVCLLSQTGPVDE